MRPVTDLTKYRMVRQSPVMMYLRLSETIQQIACGLVAFQFSAHRDFIRLFLR